MADHPVRRPAPSAVPPRPPSRPVRRPAPSIGLGDRVAVPDGRRETVTDTKTTSSPGHETPRLPSRPCLLYLTRHL